MHEIWFSCSTYSKWTKSIDLLLPTWLMAYDHEIEISTPYELDKQLDLLPNLPWLIDAIIWQCCWDYAPQMYMSQLIIDLWLWKRSDTELALKIDLILQDCKDFWPWQDRGMWPRRPWHDSRGCSNHSVATELPAVMCPGNGGLWETRWYESLSAVPGWFRDEQFFLAGVATATAGLLHTSE